MKKILLLSVVAFGFAACNSSTTENTETTTNSTDTMPVDTGNVVVDNTTVNIPVDSAYPETYNDYVNGDIKLQNGKTVVYDNGQWIPAKEVKLDNGTLVMTSGKVTKDGNTYTLKEGEVVTKSGNFFDKTGHALRNAWGDTKDALKNAGGEVKDAANKVGSEIKEGVNKMKE